LKVNIRKKLSGVNSQLSKLIFERKFSFETGLRLKEKLLRAFKTYSSVIKLQIDSFN